MRESVVDAVAAARRAIPVPSLERVLPGAWEFRAGDEHIGYFVMDVDGGDGASTFVFLDTQRRRRLRGTWRIDEERQGWWRGPKRFVHLTITHTDLENRGVWKAVVNTVSSLLIGISLGELAMKATESAKAFFADDERGPVKTFSRDRIVFETKLLDHDEPAWIRRPAIVY